MKVLMTGSTGMLGSAMYPILKEYGHEVVTTNFLLTHPDVRNIVDMEKAVDLSKPDIFLHLAAMTDVDACELNDNLAYDINYRGTQNIAEVCRMYKVPMLYVSTIGVFYGDKEEPYVETDVPCPANVYGYSKLLGERAVQKLLNKYYIVRAGWMMGGGPQRDKKFVGKIIRQAKENHVLISVDDKYGSPTYVRDFSRVVAQLITTDKYGLYHCTNQGKASRYEITKVIVDCLGTGNVIVPVHSSYFEEKYKKLQLLTAPRADSETAINENLKKIGLDSMRPWEVALRDYIKKDWM